MYVASDTLRTTTAQGGTTETHKTWPHLSLPHLLTSALEPTLRKFSTVSFDEQVPKLIPTPSAVSFSFYHLTL